jgi:transcriptional regulator with XRE-family HTH domain
MKPHQTKVREEFGQRLKELRLALGLTQTDMAYAVGIQVARYNKYEIGRSEAPYDILIKISRLTKASLDHLIGGERGQISRSTERVDELIGELVNAIPIPAIVFDKAERVIAHNKPYQEMIFDNRPGVIRPGTPHETIIRAWAYSKGFSESETEELVRRRLSPTAEPGSIIEFQIANRLIKLAESHYGDYKLVLVMEISDL